MAWEDVPAKLIAYDAETYADNTKGTTASVKLIGKYTGGHFGLDMTSTLLLIPAARREEFEEELDYRYGAVVNLRESRAIKPELLNGDVKKS